MSADIVSLFPDTDHVPSMRSDACVRSSAQFDAHVAGLMAAAYSLSGSLLAGIAAPANYLAQFIDEPALLAALGQHSTRDKLYRLLLGYALLEEGRAQLWGEIEDGLQTHRTKGLSRDNETRTPVITTRSELDGELAGLPAQYTSACNRGPDEPGETPSL